MAEIKDLSTTDANNTGTAANAGFPENMAYSDVNNAARALEGMIARHFADSNGTLTTTGSSNAYLLTPNRTVAAYTAGDAYMIKASFTNTGAVTIDVGSLGAKSIVKPSGDALAAGEITSGGIYAIIYDGSNFQMAGADDPENLTLTSLTVTGTTALNGDTTIGDAASDTVTITADVASDLIPSADGTHDLGAVGAEWQDLFVTGTANIDSLVADTADIDAGTIDGTVIGGNSAAAITGTTITADTSLNIASDGATVTGIKDEDDMASDSATKLATQQSIKAYVDSQVTAQDLDFQADSGGALSVDLDSQTFTLTGGTGIDTSGSGQTVTFAIDSTVATLTGSQTLTNKTLTSPVLNTSVSGTAVLDEDNMASDSDTQLATQQSIKAYVDSQVTAQDLDFQADSGGALSIDLDSETLTFTGGTGIDTSGSGNAVTFAIDSTVATLTGSQTLTNKTLTSPDINTPDIDGGAIDGTTIGGSTPAAGSFTTGSFSGNVSFADNAKAIFGADSDLQIYHDGSNSYISDQGTNDLKVLATDFQLKNAADTEFMMTAVTDGAVTLYHNNASKLATTSTGIDVTGQVKATSDFIAADSGGTARGYLFGTSSGLFARFNSGGTFQVQESGSTKLTVNSTGIDVTGTVTADGLTVDGGTSNVATTFKSTDATVGIKLEDNTGNVELSATGNVFNVQPAGGSAILTASSTGVGISTSSPDQLLQLGSETYGANAIIKTQVDGSDAGDFDAGLHMRSHNDDFGGSIVLESRSSTNDIINFKYHNNSSAGVSAMAIDATNGNLSIGNDTSTSTVSKTFTTGHASANRGKNIQFGMSDSTFAGMEVVNAAAANTSYNAQSINFITHEGAASVGTRMAIGSTGLIQIGNAGSSSSPTIQSLIDPDTGIFWGGGDILGFSSGGSEAMRISSGAVGIGTVPPTTNSHSQLFIGTEAVLLGSSGGALDIGNNLYYNGGWKHRTTGAASILDFSAAGEIVFYNLPSASADAAATFNEAMRISGGILKVNTTATNANISVATPKVITDNSFGVNTGHNIAAYSVDRINFDGGNYYVLNASSTGVRLINGQTSWTTQSDENLKENITELDGVLSKIKGIRCVTYNLKAQAASDKKIGFIAQDWQADFVETVNEDPADGMLGMNYSETIPVLMKAIQEQQTLIESLTDRIAALENN